MFEFLGVFCGENLKGLKLPCRRSFKGGFCSRKSGICFGKDMDFPKGNKIGPDIFQLLQPTISALKLPVVLGLASKLGKRSTEFHPLKFTFAVLVFLFFAEMVPI
jgi:hypothetical protein